jgi:hypothetical protein
MRLNEIEAASAEARREKQLRVSAQAAADKGQQLRDLADRAASNDAGHNFKPIKPKGSSAKTIKPSA